jgi:hypothetical protein
MRLRNCWLLLPLALSAQMSPNLTVTPIPTVKAAKGATATVAITAHLPAGYHANSNKPTEAYLIPLTLKWTSGPLTMDSIAYPAGSMEKYSFSDKPLSVVTGDFTITTKFKVPADAAPGPAAETGTLRYQACDNHACYPPKNVPVNVTVSVE